MPWVYDLEKETWNDKVINLSGLLLVVAMVSALCVVMVVVTQDDEGGDLAEVDLCISLICVIFFQRDLFSDAEVDNCCFPHFSISVS